MGKTKRRRGNTTRRKAKGKRQARGTRRFGGVKNLGIRSTLERWYNTVRNRFWRTKAEQPEEQSNSEVIPMEDISQETDVYVKTFKEGFLKDYVKKFLNCYKKEYFFYRGKTKRGRCKVLSEYFPSIYCMSRQLKFVLKKRIEHEMDKLAGEVISKDFVRNYNQKILDQLSNKLVKKAISSFQILTGYEKNINLPKIPNTSLSYTPETNDEPTNVFYQKIIQGGWGYYPNAISRSVDNYLTDKEQMLLEKQAYNKISRVMTPYGLFGEVLDESDKPYHPSDNLSDLGFDYASKTGVDSPSKTGVEQQKREEASRNPLSSENTTEEASRNPLSSENTSEEKEEGQGRGKRTKRRKRQGTLN
jgi:hypothetical protein